MADEKEARAAPTPQPQAQESKDVTSESPDTPHSSPPDPLESPDGAVAQKKMRPEREPGPKDLIRVFSYATRWDIVAYVLGVLSSAGAGLTLPLMNIVFGQLIRTFQQFSPGGLDAEHFMKREVNRLALIMFGLFIARFGLNYINKVTFRMIGIRMSSAVRLHYLRALFAQSIHVLDSMPSGSAASTITSTANVLQLGISEKLGVFVEFTVMIIGAIVIAFVYSWSLTLVTASGILFMVLVIGILLPVILKGHGRTTRAESKATAVASEAFGSVRMIAACGAEKRMSERYSYWSNQARILGQRTAPVLALQFGLVFFSMYAMFALAFWYGAKSFAERRVGSVGDVIIVLMSVMLVVISLERISSPLIAASKAMVAACEFFTVIDAPAPPAGHLKEPDVSATEDIVFKNVTFAYPSRPHVKVLDDLDLTVEAGKLTAIVGPSGSGKSTIVGLIQRWYTLHEQYIIAKAVEQDKKKKEKKAKKAKNKSKGAAANNSNNSDSSDDEETPANMADEDTGPAVELKGTIQTAGHDLNDIDLKWWRSQIGLVQQEPFLFNDTIFKNVSFGLIGSEWENETDEKKRELVKEACQEAFADEFIDRLPDGYDTMVGESGAKLSGGQRQRIAIARSIVRKPRILILDEATSAIDVRGERIVQAALDRVAKNRTTITIAHRLSTIKRADRIIVLKKGRVAEAGTHDELLQNEAGVYYGLVHAQQLSLGEPSDDSGDDVKEEDIGAILSREKSVARSDAQLPDDTSANKERGFFGSFIHLLVEQKSRWLYYVFTIFWSAVAASSVPLMAFLFAQIIDIFSDEHVSRAGFWSLMWVALAVGTGVAYFFMGSISTYVSFYVSDTYRKQYFEAILYQKTSFFDLDENAQGTLTSRVSGDPKHLEEMSGLNIAMVYMSIFSLVGALIISFYYGWKLALVAFFVTMPIGLVSGYFRFKYELEFDKINEAVFEESSKFASESIGAFRTVSSLTLEDFICNRYENLLRNHVSVAFKKALWTSCIFAFSDSSGLACQALIFWYGGQLLSTGEYNNIQFLVCMMAVIQGAESAGQGLSFGPNAAQAAQAANRIMNMRESRSQGMTGGDGISDADKGIKVELRNIHFRYPTRNVNVFKGLNLTIEKGQFAALVGASGCGKTSIVSLLERFYDAQKGEILANGKNIYDMDVFAYRKHLSLVAQEATLFQGTFRENILLGVDEADVSDEQLHQVCRDASIHDFIVSLPEGYNTNLGSKGVSLSGGQKQRVAIARALIRNPSVLLLDEATSSLDSESEKIVQAALERAGKGRTMVVVAHRLATVQNADIIFVLGEGKILEQGNHVDLLKKRGVYWNMCQSQALDR